jgi:hypothetical protein
MKLRRRLAKGIDYSAVRKAQKHANTEATETLWTVSSIRLKTSFH